MMRLGSSHDAETARSLQCRRRLGPAGRALVFGFLLLSIVAAEPAGAQDGDDDVDAAQSLADRYAPILMVKAQTEPCDSEGEAFVPTAVELILDNPQIALRQVGNGDPVVKWAPTGADLFGLGEGFHLDFPGSALSPGCIYERDFLAQTEGQPSLVYAHIVVQEDRPDVLALQYWFYWYYNDWNNTHESDWEGIQLLFPASSIEEALTVDPTSVGYAQHGGGERADWGSDKLVREDGTHPVVFPSAGSHASYFSSALYLGRSGAEGFGCDNTDGPSTRVEPRVQVLPDSATSPGDEFAWMGFGGRWGERQAGSFDAPTGPLAKSRWNEPVDWHEDLRESSFVVPSGDSQGLTVIAKFCDVVEFGSVQLIRLMTSPARLLVVLVVLAWLASVLIRRTSWKRVEPLPIEAPRRAGEAIRAAALLYREHPRSLLGAGLLTLPVVLLVPLVTAAATSVPFVGDVIRLAGTGMGSRLVLALIAGGLAELLALTFGTAAVATLMQGISAGEPMSLGDVLRFVVSRAPRLAGAFVRTLGIVVLLFVSVVGIPFGVRQIVRYQFISHAIMLGDADASGALRRSSELVRGRWWRTAVMVAFVNTVVASGGLAVGLVLLVVATSMPLWALSFAVALVGAVLMPWGAAVFTLLYGDAVVEHGDTVGEPADDPAFATV